MNGPHPGGQPIEEYTVNAAEAIKAQEQIDAEAWATVKNDPVDPHGFFHVCEHHEGTEHAGHYFLTYCIVCPEDQGNGHESAAAYQARMDARNAEWDGIELPF